MTVTNKKEKILIIESDGVFGENISKLLKDNGYSVTLAKDGSEGLKIIYDTIPHLILLDITLSGISGYDILEKKQAEPMLSKIPVFLMSSQGVAINMRQVPQGSVIEFLMAVEVSPSDILHKVDNYFGYEDPVVATATVAKSTDHKKVLWVEDDKLIGTILAKKLLSSGFDLVHANNGEEADAALKQAIPDAIIVDLLLPGMSGFDILQKINMDERLKKVPTMVLSNLSKPSDIEKAKVLGAKKFLVKAATSLDQIVAEVKALLA